MSAERTPPQQPPSESRGEKNGNHSSSEDCDVRPWPELEDEDQWTIELMEELLETTEQGPDELRSRAAKLREAALEGNPGQQDAALALADRYDQVAKSRVG